MNTAELKREAQKAESWIRNVMRIYGWDQERAHEEAKKHFKILNPKARPLDAANGIGYIQSPTSADPVLPNPSILC